MKFAVVTVSDSCSAGSRVDESGKTLIALISASSKVRNPEISDYLTADELENIHELLGELVSKSYDVVITTGGTGFSKRDVTPEATLKVIEKRCNGLEIALHSRSLQATPMAALSRAVCGIAKDTLIVNFPGSVKAVKECWEVLEPVLNHAVDLIRGKDDGSQHAKMK